MVGKFQHLVNALETRGPTVRESYKTGEWI